MWNPTSAVRDGLALAFASLFPAVMAFVYFVVLNDPGGETNLAFLAAFGVGKAVQFLFPIVYVYWFERKQIRFTMPTRDGLVLGATFGVIVGAAMFALYFGAIQHIPAVSEQTPTKILSKLTQMGHGTPIGYLQLAAYICIVHSFLEEYYWRWFVFGWMRRYVSLTAAIVLSSIGFMLHHVVILGVYFPEHFWTLAMPFSLCVAIGGGVWAWIYQRTGSIYAAWLSHALIDAAILGLGYWMLRGFWAGD
jgi:uncharacterized protein